MVASHGSPNRPIADPRIHTAEDCAVLHWDVLNLYSLRLSYKPQFLYIWLAVCIP